LQDIVDQGINRHLEFVKRRQEEETTQEADPDILTTMEADDDLPLFLDAMLFYLRIQADAYAKVVPYFYQSPDGLQIPWRSFRDQLKCFIHQRRAQFDPGYTSILGSNCAWFERLAGKGNERGLRDVVVHHSGTLLVAWTKPEGGQIEPHTGLAGVGGIVEADVFRALREINTGWCAFLDAASLHFVKRLVADGNLSPADDIKELISTVDNCSDASEEFSPSCFLGPPRSGPMIYLPPLCFDRSAPGYGTTTNTCRPFLTLQYPFWPFQYPYL
jgi:hypothetical protein